MKTLLCTMTVLLVSCNAYSVTLDQYELIAWDCDGTVIDPTKQDFAALTMVTLPGVEEVMKGRCNVMLSGTKSTAATDYNVEDSIRWFTHMMQHLPLSAIAFAASKEGTTCYVLVKNKQGLIEVRGVHKDDRYAEYVGKFRKPDVGMFVVLGDIVQEIFGADIKKGIMIGDSPLDEEGAKNFGMPFLDVTLVHQEGSIIQSSLAP